MRWKENQKHTGGSLEGEETQRHWITPVPCSWMQLDHLSVAFQLFLFASGLRRLARGISCSSPESPETFPQGHVQPQTLDMTMARDLGPTHAETT